MAEKKTDRRTLKTKKALQEALSELLTEKQLQKITVQEIADKADVNRVTFYKHYLDVYDLYEQIEADVLIELGIMTLSLTELSADDFFSHLISVIAENRTIYRMIFSPNSTGQLRSKFSKMIEGLFLQIHSEKIGKNINDKELEYINCYRAHGCISVISKWVLDDYSEPQKFVAKSLSAIDNMISNQFYNISDTRKHQAG
jgi:hypothetical protein